jgi:CheY-like chemotaxis protein
MPLEDKVSVMIVEDDANIRYLLEAAAERLGIFSKVTVAVDGLAALDTLRQANASEHPAFIATDLSMPRMNGIELIRALKADPLLRHIPIGVITSSDVPNDRSDAFAAGACSFLAKPHGLEALKQALLAMHDSCVPAHEPVTQAREQN